MSLGDITAKININLRDVVTFFTDAGIQEKSIALLNKFIDAKQHLDFLSLIEGYAKNMPFIDHQEFGKKLLVCWGLVLDSCSLEKKLLQKKIKALQDDKKADPDALAKQENLMRDLDTRKCSIMISYAKVKSLNLISFSDFIDDENLDYKAKFISEKLGATIKK